MSLEVDRGSQLCYTVHDRVGLRIDTREGEAIKRHWPRGLVLGVTVALLLAGGVALAQTLNLTAEHERVQSSAGRSQDSPEENPAESFQGNLWATNLVLNGGFEDGVYSPTESPDHWSPDSWTSGATFTWDSTQSYQGTKSVRISLTTPNDARWIQTVAVQLNTDYRLSGWIKTEDVAHTVGTVDAGANLSVYGTWTRTAALIGTNDWTNVSLTFNTGSSSQVVIGARVGYWSGTTTGTAWFDELRLEPVGPPSLSKTAFLPLVMNAYVGSTSPRWRILVLAYESTDFTYTDGAGEQHHFVANMTQADKDRLAYAASRFVNSDVPALNSRNMEPSVTIRYPTHALDRLTPMGCSDYAPSPSDAAPDRDSAFDSVIAVWDGSGTDLMTGQSMSIQGCAWAWHMGTGQTYVAIPVDYSRYNDRNIFKHEWGHSILFYYDAAGTAPKPPVDNHINDTTNRYVNCITGQPYILQDETDDNPIPNSIYHNESGFTHDYYSGMTATADQPTRCLGIRPAAWASGGPVSRPPSDVEVRWRGPSDDVIGPAVPSHWDRGAQRFVAVGCLPHSRSRASCLRRNSTQLVACRLRGKPGARLS